MPKALYAQVAIESALPQLDRYFDYAVPEELQNTIAVGQRVRVPFGRNKSNQDALVVGLTDSIDYTGKLGSIAELVSEAKVLQPDVLALCRAVADRQAATLADVLTHAVPSRSVAVEKKWLAEASDSTTTNVATNLSLLIELGQRIGDPCTEELRSHQLIEPRSREAAGHRLPVWALEAIRIALAQLIAGKSTIIVVPDFRDQNAIRDGLKAFGLDSWLRDYTQEQTKGAKYGQFLATISEPKSIVVGSRSAVFAPAQNLGAIVIWDDGDPSLQDQGSPYVHAREVALVRQSQTNCQLAVLGHSISAESQRLIEIGYLSSVKRDFAKPKVAVTDAELRIDSLAIKVIREATAAGSVLVQVAAKGHSTSAFCQSCSTRANCQICNGPVWLNTQRQPACRWCNAINLAFRCRTCGSTDLRFGRPGSTRTIAELGRMFPGVQLVESTHETKTSTLKAGRKIVVATPGAEPSIEGGYEAVILLDCAQALGKDSLRATEDAVRSWSNAIAHLGEGGRAVAVGLGGELGQWFALWNQSEIAGRILAERRELGFPPAERLMSATGSSAIVNQAEEELASTAGLQVIGKTTLRSTDSTEPQLRLLARYPYSAGAEVAQAVRALQLKLAAGPVRGGRPGRSARALTVKMDDGEVI